MPPAPRILVVDDNPDSLDLLVALLSAQPYAIETATTGRQALDAVAAAPPALILLDVILPDIDGHEIARRVKADPALPFIPIILVTARGDLQEKIHGLDQGADDFLSKPVNRAELNARVRALLRLKQAQDGLLRQHEELRALHLRLRESEAHREQLVQMITHDLRGPLSGLIGALELLDDESLGPLGTDQHLFVRQSLQNSQLLNDMVSDLLDVYRLEASGGELRGEPVDLHALADLADMQVRGAIVEKRLTLDNAIAADLPRIWGDRNKLLRVFANLLHNAVKYTDRGGITLSAEISPDNGFAHAAERGGPESPPGVQYLIVHVRDTGVGIPDDARAYVFEKFYRVSQRTPGRAPRGTGLGLYFCKRVVEAHGGNIWVDPAPNGGRGSVFSFSVPVSVPA